MIVVVGGGPAGAATACFLAAAGQRVTVLERDRAPRERICGEFLSHETCSYLGRLGLDLAGFGAAPIERVALSSAHGVSVAPLGFTAAGLSRRVLDPALRARATEYGATVLTGRQVRAIDRYGAEAETRYAADAVVLATGKHDVRGRARPGTSDLVGFKLHLRLSPIQARAASGTIRLLLFRDGYAGLQPIEGGRANLCLMVRQRRLDRADGTWPALLHGLTAESAALRDVLHGAELLMDRPLTIARVPYGFVYGGEDDGVYRVGDQMAVIPSFSGDGMAIALHTASVAAATLLAGGTAAAHHARTARELRPSVRRATALQRLGYAPLGQDAMALGARFWPGALTRAAAATRIPGRHLHPTGLP